MFFDIEGRFPGRVGAGQTQRAMLCRVLPAKPGASRQNTGSLDLEASHEAPRLAQQAHCVDAVIGQQCAAAGGGISLSAYRLKTGSRSYVQDLGARFEKAQIIL